MSPLGRMRNKSSLLQNMVQCEYLFNVLALLLVVVLSSSSLLLNYYYYYSKEPSITGLFTLGLTAENDTKVTVNTFCQSLTAIIFIYF